MANPLMLFARILTLARQRCQTTEDRYEKKSVIIASQLPVDKWYDYIAEATLADAIMDRLVNSSNLIKLEGPSMRQRRKR